MVYKIEITSFSSSILKRHRVLKLHLQGGHTVFIANLTYVKPLTEVEKYLEEHVAFLEKY